MIKTYRCKKCGTLWNYAREGSTWCLTDPSAKPGVCCDNADDFLSVIEPVPPEFPSDFDILMDDLRDSPQKAIGGAESIYHRALVALEEAQDHIASVDEENFTLKYQLSETNFALSNALRHVDRLLEENKVLRFGPINQGH